MPRYGRGIRYRPSAISDCDVRRKALVLRYRGVKYHIRMGKGLRANDAVPYRSLGPVTAEEYLSREERYDKQMAETIGVSPEGKSVEEKIAITRRYREARYEQLIDAVYKRRGWSAGGVPTIEHLKEIGMDLPAVLEVAERALRTEA